jgi:hypothetical protein
VKFENLYISNNNNNIIIGYPFNVHHKIKNKESKTPYYKKKKKGKTAKIQKKL